jgi:hypothetical protein
MNITRRFIFGLVGGLTLAQSGLAMADTPDRFKRLIEARTALYDRWAVVKDLPRQERNALLAEAGETFAAVLEDDFPVRGQPTDADIEFTRKLFRERALSDRLKAEGLPEDDIRGFNSNAVIQLISVYHALIIERVGLDSRGVHMGQLFDNISPMVFAS